MTSMRGFAQERRAAGEREVGDGTQPVDVGPAVGRLVVHDLLGRHVKGRAGDGSLLRDMDRIVFTEGLHQAEIEQLGDVMVAATIGRHQVGRLDVAMNQARVVSFAQGIARLASR